MSGEGTTGPAAGPPDECIGSDVARAATTRPYGCRPGDPLYRSLRIYTLDPAASEHQDAATAVVRVPFEPLGPGLRGSLFEVDPRDGGNGACYRTLDLDDRAVLLDDGVAPSPSNPLFHQQMVYAVCSLVYAAFRKALGRDVAWGFSTRSPASGSPGRLQLRPYGAHSDNAWYDRELGALVFGYYRTQPGVTDRGRNLPGGLVFTSLSHDVVVHEVSHALLDGLRAYFLLPTSPQVLAFHEGFADTVALLQRFSYAETVRVSLVRSRGELAGAANLVTLAGQLGQTLDVGDALRTAVAPAGAPPAPDDGREPHELGGRLLRAIFGAFITIFRRRVERDVSLVTGGTGVLPPGELPHDLADVLAERASKIAAQFQTLCIRAIDYCPPVDVQFGEFLRAVITADRELVPDDPWGYREAWIDAFRQARIYPPGVDTLSEDALLWRPPEETIGTEELAFARLRFTAPGRPAGAPELRRQALALCELVSAPRSRHLFGLANPGDPRLGGDEVDTPTVQSIRGSRRIGPDGQTTFDLVAEVTQVRLMRGTGSVPGMEFKGGATVILGPDGTVRYVIRKSILNEDRLEAQQRFASAPEGGRYWPVSRGMRRPLPDPLALIHLRAPRRR